MTVHLTRIETVIYFGVYIFALAYGFYNAYLVGTELPQWTLPKGSILERRQDLTEHNWLSFKRRAEEYPFWLVAHILSSEICRIIWPMKVPVAHAINGIIFIVYNGFPWGLIFITVMAFYVAMRMSRRCIWFLAIVCLSSRQFVRIVDALYVLSLDDYSSMADFLLLYTWLIMRLTSYSLDFNKAMRKCCANQNISRVYSFSNYLGYVFYMPVMIHGPPLIYKRYAKLLSQKTYDDFAKRSVDMFCMIVRLTCSGFFLELAKHFVYAEYICENPHIANRVNRWALMGFTVAIGLYFNIFCMISYGVGTAIANFDRIEAPNLPVCVAHVNIYSNMWRYFDQGLYEYIYRYIYRDVRGGMENSTKWRKFAAALAVFLFIWTWQGLKMSVLIFCALNVICFEMEIIGKCLTYTRFYSEVRRTVGAEVCHRINCFFGSQLLMVSVITNVYFIAGDDVGKVIAHRAFVDVGFWEYLVASTISYCCYQACEFLNPCEDLILKEIKEMVMANTSKKIE